MFINKKSYLIFIVITVVALSLSYPKVAIFQATMAKNIKDKNLSKNVNKENSGKIKRCKLSKLNTDKKNAQINIISKHFINELFIERNVENAFELYTNFGNLDDTDKDFINQKSFLDTLTKDLGNKMNLRISVAIWNYGFQNLYLSLGLYPLPSGREGEKVLPSTSDYDDLFESVLKQNNSSIPNFDFTGLNKEQIEERLDDIEKNFKDTEKLIFERIDPILYRKNIEEMKNSIKIKKKVDDKRTYYVVGVQPSFAFVFASKNNEMKIIHLSGGS